MANIIRCKLPDGKTHRFSPFKTSDYRDFLLIRNDMKNYDENEQTEILDELMEEYFPKYPKTWREYIFIKTFTSSIGKTIIPVTFQCPICGKKTPRFFNLKQDPLINPSVVVDDGVEIFFDFPTEKYETMPQMILSNVREVNYHGKIYKWDELDDPTKESLIDLITFEKFETLIKKLKPMHFSLEMNCCEKSTIVYDTPLDVFKLLVNPDEVFSFYTINHMLAKHHYDNDSVMNMLPIERTMILSVIEREKAKEKENK